MPAKRSKLTSGQRFGRLTFVKDDRVVGRNWHGWFLCDCGSEVSLRISHVTTGTTMSCKCLRAEMKNNLSHGESYTVLYRKWASMCTRTKPDAPSMVNHPTYENVRTCQRWRDSFLDFKADLETDQFGTRYVDGMCIGRLDHHGDYTYENVQWEPDRAFGSREMMNRRWEEYWKFVDS